MMQWFKRAKRPRMYLIFGGLIAVVTALLLTDPDKGFSTAMALLSVASGVVAVAAAHVARKGLFDYIDLQEFAKRAGQESTGAGLVFASVCAVLCVLLLIFSQTLRAQDVRSYIPTAAQAQLPVLRREVQSHWQDVPDQGYLAALVEHESCITLQHSRCWQATSRLKTPREEGAGMGQLTRAWHADGRVRFDALAQVKQQHPALRELSWGNVYQRPDLQLRALVLMSKANYQVLAPHAQPMQRLAFADAAYNGGLGGLQKERRACGMQADCDAQQWWDNVERVCLKSHRALYAGRSACTINRHHVRDVLKTRMPKYSKAMQGMV